MKIRLIENKWIWKREEKPKLYLMIYNSGGEWIDTLYPGNIWIEDIGEMIEQEEAVKLEIGLKYSKIAIIGEGSYTVELDWENGTHKRIKAGILKRHHKFIQFGWIDMIGRFTKDVKTKTGIN